MDTRLLRVSLIKPASIPAQSSGFALRALFSGLTTESYARAADLHVSASSLGAGYVVFFLYTAVIGVAGIILAMILAARREPPASDAASPGAA